MELDFDQWDAAVTLASLNAWHQPTTLEQALARINSEVVDTWGGVAS